MVSSLSTTAYGTAGKLIRAVTLMGTEAEVMVIENNIKKFTRKKKEQLIDSKENVLICYKPLKFVTLRKSNDDGDVLIKIR